MKLDYQTQSPKMITSKPASYALKIWPKKSMELRPPWTAVSIHFAIHASRAGSMEAKETISVLYARRLYLRSHILVKRANRSQRMLLHTMIAQIMVVLIMIQKKLCQSLARFAMNLYMNLNLWMERLFLNFVTVLEKCSYTWGAWLQYSEKFSRNTTSIIQDNGSSTIV